MADRWQTYSVEYAGGLITNLSPYQHGIKAPGSARILRNFEPSVFGGYRRVEGYVKLGGTSTNIPVVPNSGLIRGVLKFGSNFLAFRGDDLFLCDGQASTSSWTQVSDTTAYPASSATAVVNGAISSTTALVVDGNSGTIKAGMVVTGTGISGTVTVSSLSDQNNLVLSSNQTLSNDVTLTFKETSPTIGGSSGKVRFLKYNFDGTEKLFIVDGTGKPFRFTGSVFEQLSSLPSDTSGASHVVNFKGHIFLANGTKLVHSAPEDETDFSVANGGGVFNIGDTITGLIVFREQLIIFTRNTISVLQGTSTLDFVLQPVSRSLGCVSEDTIQEIGGDIIFLGPDGLRLFSATDKIGDFGLAVISKPIQTEMLDLTSSSPNGFSSIVIREKSQYRIFGFNTSTQDNAAKGIAGTQLEDGIKWNDLRGFNAHVAFSEYDFGATGASEVILFGNATGFVYQMEQGNTQDGAHINATFATPFIPLQDPEVRKTIYKGTTYLDVNGSFDLEYSLKFDFDQPDGVQPDSTLTTDSAASVTYGEGVFGTSLFGNKQKAIYEVQTVGSGFTVSLLYETTGSGTDAVFSIDSATLEYAVNDRR